MSAFRLIRKCTTALRDVQICRDAKRTISTAVPLAKSLDRKAFMKSIRTNEGVDGERFYNVDPNVISGALPTLETLQETFDGVSFTDLHICHINCSKNNTKLAVTDSNHHVYITSTVGCEGFKNAKKGTDVAGQAVGIAVGMKSLKAGIKTVRVKLTGLGPGRTAAIKGLTLAGVKIVSITDTTPLPELGPRPRKARRI